MVRPWRLIGGMFAPLSAGLVNDPAGSLADFFLSWKSWSIFSVRGRLLLENKREKAGEANDFLETVLRLDACEDTREFLDFIQGKRHETQDMLAAMSQLLAKGRVRSSYIIGMLLFKRGQQNLLMSVGLFVGGLIFGNPVEEENGLRHLQSQVDALSDAELQEAHDRLVAPLVNHLWACSTAQADSERVLRFLRHFQRAVAEEFDWRPRVCPLCEGSADYWFHAQLLHKYRVAFYRCDGCDFLCTEEPYWLEEAYAGVVDRRDVDDKDDADGVARALRLKGFVSMLLRNLFDAQAKFLDYEGSYGLFVRLMRDEGFAFYWQDRHCPNLFARGFDRQAEDRYALVTAFECFQHFVNPAAELEHLLEQSDAVLLTTPLLPDPPPRPEDWPHYALEGGRHVSFYSLKSLRKWASSRELTFLSNGTDTHLFARRHISNGVFKGLSRWGGGEAVLSPAEEELLSAPQVGDKRD
ncbi:MAG: class I SAM-dependent methyltransferase [Magnetococcus sp. XQGC-1]